MDKSFIQKKINIVNAMEYKTCVLPYINLIKPQFYETINDKSFVLFNTFTISTYGIFICPQHIKCPL